MKKRIHKLLAVAVALVLTSSSQKTVASHYMGSDLTYSCIGPGIYLANLKLYRDCTGASAPTSATLNIKATNCNPGRNITMSRAGGQVIGMPYCSQIVPNCTTTGLTNYEETTFTATVAFSTAEQNCPDWLLSWTECCRPEATNLVNPSGANLYTEAMVKLGSNINNNSPLFSPLNVPILFVNHGQPIQISSYALEPDGDSLVYSLQNPLTANNTPVAFGTYNNTLIFNSDATKYCILPAGTYSNTYPIISYSVDWSLPVPITPVQKFMFDSKTGTIGFIPNKYEPNSPSAQGKNKYVMAVQTEEYRKVNGVMVKVGAIRRDILINVIDCGPNENPNINTPVANGQAISENTIINLRPGTPLNFQFTASDGNATNILNVTSDVQQVLPGAVFATSSASQPTGTVSWTPAAGDVRNQPYYFHITVNDNACPAKGFQVHTFGVKVSATGGVTGIQESSALNNEFTVYPNPFNETVTFKFNLKTKAESILIYNILGQQVDKIRLVQYEPGEQKTKWQHAGKFAPGTYVARLISGDKTVQTLKFTKLN